MKKQALFLFLTSLALCACVPSQPAPTTTPTATLPLPPATFTPLPTLFPEPVATFTPSILRSESSCTDDDSFSCGELMLSNNPWGKGEITNYSQCVGMQETADGCSFSWTWYWPQEGGGVKAYPEIIYGWKPWISASTTAHLPVRVGDIGALRVSYAMEEDATGLYNTSFDLWITSSAEPTPETITKEIMVWVQESAGWEGGNPTLVMLNGERYEFYDYEMDEWRYLAFHYPYTQLEGTVDLKMFIDYLVEQEIIYPGEYLASIEFGNEVVYSQGSTQISRFVVEWE